MTGLLDFLVSKTGAFINLAKRYADLELENGRLTRRIAEQEREIAGLIAAIEAMKAEIAELKSRKQEDKDNPLTISVSGIYFDTHGKPFCTGCYDGPTGRRVHLVYKNADYSSIIYACPVCKTEYQHREDVGLAKPPTWSRRRNREEW